MPAILGVDPGASGAAAVYWPDKSPASGLRWQVIDLPTVGDPACLNAAAFRDWLRKLAPDHAYVELVNAMPVMIDRKTGARRVMPATSAFRFGGSFFAMQAVLSCCDVPFTLITPQKWKAAHGLKGPDKEQARQRALRLFPEAAAYLARKMDQNRAEAMLLAKFGSDIHR